MGTRFRPNESTEWKMEDLYAVANGSKKDGNSAPGGRGHEGSRREELGRQGSLADDTLSASHKGLMHGPKEVGPRINASDGIG
jgi:hypothetical protein